MSPKPHVWLRVALVLAVLGNLGQFVWSLGEDRVIELSGDGLSRAQLDARIAEDRAIYQSSAAWTRVWVDTPEEVVFEVATMANVRGLLDPHPQRTFYVWHRGR